MCCERFYDWAHRFQQRRAEPIIERIRDRPRPGRPGHKRQKAKEMILSVIHTDPRDAGYRSPVWTTPLLRHHLEWVHQLQTSGKTVRGALKDLGYHCKRRRYTLARRSPQWRQAKGGSNGA